MKKQGTWLLIASFICLKSIGQTTYLFNDIPAVADSVACQLYVTIDESLTENGKIAITSNQEGNIVWDGDTIHQGIARPFNHALAVHTLKHLSTYADTTTWKVVLTPLPIICLDFDDPSSMDVFDSPCTLRILSREHPTEYQSDFISRALARFRGSSSLEYPKKISTSPLPTPKVRRATLRSWASDKTVNGF